MPERMPIEKLKKLEKRFDIKGKKIDPRDEHYIRWRTKEGIIEATGRKVVEVDKKIHLHTPTGYYVIPKDSIIEQKSIS